MAMNSATAAIGAAGGLGVTSLMRSVSGVDVAESNNETQIAMQSADIDDASNQRLHVEQLAQDANKHEKQMEALDHLNDMKADAADFEQTKEMGNLQHGWSMAELAAKGLQQRMTNTSAANDQVHLTTSTIDAQVVLENARTANSVTLNDNMQTNQGKLIDKQMGWMEKLKILEYNQQDDVMAHTESMLEMTNTGNVNMIEARGKAKSMVIEAQNGQVSSNYDSSKGGFGMPDFQVMSFDSFPLLSQLQQNSGDQPMFANMNMGMNSKSSNTGMPDSGGGAINLGSNIQSIMNTGFKALNFA